MAKYRLAVDWSDSSRQELEKESRPLQADGN